MVQGWWDFPAQWCGFGTQAGVEDLPSSATGSKVMAPVVGISQPMGEGRVQVKWLYPKGNHKNCKITVAVSWWLLAERKPGNPISGWASLCLDKTWRNLLVKGIRRQLVVCFALLSSHKGIKAQRGKLPSQNSEGCWNSDFQIPGRGQALLNVPGNCPLSCYLLSADIKKSCGQRSRVCHLVSRDF